MFHVKLDLRSIVAALTQRQTDQLRLFESLLHDRAVPLGFVSASDEGRLWERHILDSLRSVQCLPRSPAGIVDVGSGGGLPGVPVAIARPDCEVILLEPSARRTAFLELVTQELALPNVKILVGRAESKGVVSDVAMARALSGPQRTWQTCSPLIRESGSVLYFAGSSWTPLAVDRTSTPDMEWVVCVDSEFPWQGPIVKMMRKRPSA